MQFGEHVVVPKGDVKVVGHFLGEHKNPAGETKARIQVGSEIEELTLRAPHDYDEHGGGGTYHRVGEK